VFTASSDMHSMLHYMQKLLPCEAGFTVFIFFNPVYTNSSVCHPQDYLVMPKVPQRNVRNETFYDVFAVLHQP